MLINNKKNTIGFSLLEMLLVLVLLIFLATISIALYENQSADVKTSKAALQMQQILQSAYAYYIDNNCWPNAFNCPANAPSFNNYLPINSLQIPWGEQFKYMREGQKFRVQMNLPDNFNLQERMKIARAVIAVLPTAQMDNVNDPRAVQAEITRPNKQNNNPILIAVVGETIPLFSGIISAPFNFSCPAHWIPKELAVPRAYYLPKMTCNPFARAIGSLAALVNCTPGVNNSQSCTITASHDTTIIKASTLCFTPKGESDGSFTYFYIGYCVNPTMATRQLQIF